MSFRDVLPVKFRYCNANKFMIELKKEDSFGCFERLYMKGEFTKYFENLLQKRDKTYAEISRECGFSERYLYQVTQKPYGLSFKALAKVLHFLGEDSDIGLNLLKDIKINQATMHYNNKIDEAKKYRDRYFNVQE